MIGKIKGAILSLVLAATFGLSLPTAFASDSGPGVWDFLLFGNLDMGSSFNAGTLGTNSAGTTVYKGSQPITAPGYGFGFGTEYWFSDRIAARLLLQANVFSDGFSNIKDGPFFGDAPITIGPVFKIVGSQNYFLYVPVDVGYAITASSGTVNGSGSIPVNTGGSFYADAGVGVNIRFITLEAKVAWLTNPGQYGGNSLYFPMTFGFDF